MELYYGISGIGAVCHTINPRLFEDQIVYIINHAGDRVILVDGSIAPLLAEVRAIRALLEKAERRED